MIFSDVTAKTTLRGKSSVPLHLHGCVILPITELVASVIRVLTCVRKLRGSSTGQATAYPDPRS